jgi:hypothetical protein
VASRHQPIRHLFLASLGLCHSWHTVLVASFSTPLPMSGPHAGNIFGGSTQRERAERHHPQSHVRHPSHLDSRCCRTRCALHRQGHNHADMTAAVGVHGAPTLTFGLAFTSDAVHSCPSSRCIPVKYLRLCSLMFTKTASHHRRCRRLCHKCCVVSLVAHHHGRRHRGRVPGSGCARHQECAGQDAGRCCGRHLVGSTRRCRGLTGVARVRDVSCVHDRWCVHDRFCGGCACMRTVL